MDYNERFKKINTKNFGVHESVMLDWINDNIDDIIIISVYTSNAPRGNTIKSIFHCMYKHIEKTEKVMI